MVLVSGTTIFMDTIGPRMAIIYSIVDDTTGKIISDNKRLDRVIVDNEIKERALAVLADAQRIIENNEG